MSKEKQIEEMARITKDHCEIENQCGSCACETCNECFAEILYAAGYRKQSEGEWKLGKSGCMYFCSFCGYAAHPREVDEWTHCPKCGTKMKGGAE